MITALNSLFCTRVWTGVGGHASSYYVSSLTRGSCHKDAGDRIERKGVLKNRAVLVRGQSTIP